MNPVLDPLHNKASHSSKCHRLTNFVTIITSSLEEQLITKDTILPHGSTTPYADVIISPLLWTPWGESYASLFLLGVPSTHGEADFLPPRWNKTLIWLILCFLYLEEVDPSISCCAYVIITVSLEPSTSAPEATYYNVNLAIFLKLSTLVFWNPSSVNVSLMVSLEPSTKSNVLPMPCLKPVALAGPREP